MSLVGFLMLLWLRLSRSLGQAIVGFSRGGCLASIGMGFIGAWLGWWLAGQFNLPPLLVINIDGELFPIVWAVIGAALFSALLSLFFGRREPRYSR